jgi:hypothetical protein
MIDNSGEYLLGFGADAIEWGNYEFKTMDQVREEFEKLSPAGKSKEKKPQQH